MKKVYVLTNFDNYELYIVGVFSSKDKARKEAEKIGITIMDEGDEEYHIHEMDIDAVYNKFIHVC